MPVPADDCNQCENKGGEHRIDRVFAFDNVRVMTLFTRSLWPRHVRAPYRRMAVAMIAAPAVLSAILSLIAVVLAMLSEKTSREALAAGADSALTLTAMIFLYTLTFGVAGVGVLWSLAQRSPVTWASAGLVSGAVGGFLLSELAMDRGGRALVIFAAVTSVALFLLIRALAGVQEAETRR